MIVATSVLHMPPAPTKYGLDAGANAFLWFGLGAALPALFVWALPLLSMWQVLPLRTGYPPDDEVKQSVSYYIATPPGVGCTAFLFMLPIVAMWSEEARRSVMLYSGRALKLHFYASLFAFHAAFGLFLLFTVTWVPILHAIAVCLFSLAGLYHFIVIVLNDDRAPSAELAVLVVGGLSFAALIGIQIAIWAGWSPPEYLFWAVECLALSAMVFFTPAHVYAGPTSKAMLGLTEGRQRELRALYEELAGGGDDPALTGSGLRSFLAGTGLAPDELASLPERIGEVPDGPVHVRFSQFVEVYTALLLEHGTLPLGGQAKGTAPATHRRPHGSLDRVIAAALPGRKASQPGPKENAPSSQRASTQAMV